VLKLWKKGKITTPRVLFETSIKQEVNGLTKQGVLSILVLGFLTQELSIRLRVKL
jgi:hypothetical protein